MGAWNAIVIIASAALLLVLCRKEFLRTNKARLAWRIIASVIVVASLVCMAVPIYYTETGNKAGNEIIVTTDGASRDSVLSFKKNKKPGAAIVEKEDFLSAEKNEYDTIHVFGSGFSEEELALLNKQRIVFRPAPIHTGITAASWNRRLNKGEVLAMQGTYINESATPVVLLLSGFNTVVDSVTIPSHQTKSFLLRTVPKQNGKAVFAIVALQGKDTLEKEPLPVEVLQPDPVKVMILASSPDFENKFLKDWLLQNGYGVVAKTNISTNKFDRSVFNVSNASLDHITAALLDSFDIVVSDEASLLMLPASERDAVYRQVNNKGMGLIMKGDTIAAPREWFTRPFHLFQLPGKPPTHLSLSFRGTGKAVLPVEQSQFIRLQNGVQALVKDSAANTVAAVVTEGSGKILFTTLSNTYSWLLSGNQVNYYALWNLLLQKAGRQNRSANHFEISPVLPQQHHAATITLETQSDSIPFVKTANAQPSFVQDPLVPYRWQTTWWPGETGWQPSFIHDDLIYNWYVYEKNDWRFVMAQERRLATEKYIEQQQLNKETIVAAGAREQKTVSLFWFFLPFIICSGFLWLERKIS